MAVYDDIKRGLMPDALREQVKAIVIANTAHRGQHDIPKITDAVLVVFAERERELRERIEALRMPGDGWRVFGNEQLDLVLAEFDK
jgi:hypothetical protein